MATSNIAQFYEGRSVFITGATGFMGKVLLEKLMRSCPGIDRFYLLMRCSKGKTLAVRLQELANNEVPYSLRPARRESSIHRTLSTHVIPKGFRRSEARSTQLLEQDDCSRRRRDSSGLGFIT